MQLSSVGPFHFVNLVISFAKLVVSPDSRSRVTGFGDSYSEDGPLMVIIYLCLDILGVKSDIWLLQV